MSKSTIRVYLPESARLAERVFVLCGGLVCTLYVGLGIAAHSSIKPVFLVLLLLPAALAWPAVWAAFSCLASRRLAATATVQSTSLPFVAPISLLIFLPEFVFGTPSISRIVLILFLEGVLFCLITYLVSAYGAQRILSWVESHAGYLASVFVIVHAVILTALVVLRHYHFGPTLGEDTAYYNQIFSSVIDGKFFQGSLMQDRYLDPPVHSEFEVHNSPIMFVILPFYAIYPSFYTLLTLRTVMISVSGFPLYLLAKDKMNGVVGVVLLVAYLLSANILCQALGAFYPIQFIALMLPFAFLYFSREELQPFLLCLTVCLMIREEIALTTILFGIYAAVVKRPWPWIVMPIMLSLSWWLISTKLVMTSSQITMEGLDKFFQTLGNTYNEILITVVSNPWALLELVATRDHYAYFYEISKPTMGMAFASVTAMFAMPTLAINAIVGGFWKSILGVGMHYSVVAIVSLFVAIIYGICHLSVHCRWSVKTELVQISLVALLIPVTTIGIKDVFGFGSGQERSLVNDFFRRPFQSSLEEIIEIVNKDPEASVAAPSMILPQLSKRSKLYCANWL